MTRYRLLWPIVGLVALVLLTAAFEPGVLSVGLRDGQLHGSLIDILRLAAPLLLVSLGMTLVVATGGIDLSVGSIVAITAAMAALRIQALEDQDAVAGVLVAIAVALALALVLGLWNGFLVAVIGVQPIIATLILLVSGRGLAQLITGGQILTLNSAPYDVIGGGYLFGLPFAVLLGVAALAIVTLVVRRSALGMLLESVGGNDEASRLAGIRARGLTVLVYVVSAVCAGVAGLIISSDVASADGNNAGLWIELDAILAVVIGGTLLTGGRFSFAGTTVGVLLIQAMNTAVYTIGVPADTTRLFKAVVVTLVCLLQSPAFRAKVFRGRRRRAGQEEQEDKVEVYA
jgi:galactofuranose transport system permease protein